VTTWPCEECPWQRAPERVRDLLDAEALLTSSLVRGGGPLADLAGDLCIPIFRSEGEARTWLDLILMIHGTMAEVRAARWRHAHPPEPTASG
jgi:hypothetical protein